MATKDLYAILGVERDASADEIKRAYRRLARKHHPDVNPGDAKAEETFKQISAAFDILGDADKRKNYDEFGEDATKPGFDPEKARAYRDWQSRAQASESFRGGRSRDADFGGFDLGDLFGGMGGFGGRRRARDRRGADVESRLEISLRDAVLGTERDLSFSRPKPCEACGGSGTKRGGAPTTCKECGGSGQQNVAQGPLSFRAPCPACGGTGQTSGPPCPSCGGAGQRDSRARLKVQVPSGVEDGQTIRLAGQGMPGVGAGTPGDLLIRIKVAAHPLLSRDGRDLLLDVPVTVREAMLGGKIDVPTLDGTIKLTLPAGSQTGTKLRAKGKGVPASGKRPAGDLYVVIRVQVPDANKDPELARRAADDLEKLYPNDVRAELRL